MLGALLLQMLRGQANDVFCQVGLVMLIGMSSKNAILIVEFARELRETGKSVVDAALEAAETRLRPILMTLAGVPARRGSAAGRDRGRLGGPSLARHHGLRGDAPVTVLNLFFIPVLYILVETLRERGGGVEPVLHAPAASERRNEARGPSHARGAGRGCRRPSLVAPGAGPGGAPGRSHPRAAETAAGARRARADRRGHHDG